VSESSEFLLMRSHRHVADDADLAGTISSALHRWPAVGLAVAVISGGAPARFFGHGVADVATGRQIEEDTVFRVGSLTKTMTAVAVMQLCDAGAIDLDAPANDYLRAFRLVAEDPSFGPPTVRHLLTHTAGVGYWRRLSDLVLHPASGSGVNARSLVPLAEYYRDGLPYDVEPGTRWAYSNHGFAALGEIVEDVSGEPLGRYLRDHLFVPLGMEHTGFVPDEAGSDVATGYKLGRHGPVAVVHREVPTPGGGGLYSTARDMARYLAALVGGGANEHGRVLAADTVAAMFRPHFRPDHRVPGMGLGFEPHVEHGRVLVCKGGTLAGFLSAVALVPEEQVGVVALTNTGWLDNRGTAEPLAAALVRRLIGLPDDPVRHDLAPRPDAWGQLCGWYAPDAGPVTNLFQRLTMGAGVEVAVHHGRLVMRPLTPIPAWRGEMELHPDDPDDARVFRVVMPDYGRTDRVVFTDDAPPRLLLDVMSWEKRPDWRNPRRWATAVAGVGAVGAIARIGRSRR
jgi:CubicO group peptidase (beta-lactamase class C family)